MKKSIFISGIYILYGALILTVFGVTFATICTMPIYNLEKDIYIGFLSVFVATSFFVLFQIYHEVYKPYKEIRKKINDLILSQKDELNYSSNKKKSIIEEIDLVIEYQKKSVIEENAKNLLNQKIKYAELQSQINPHFLYNTLENIRGQAIIDDNDTIAEMTEALARYFRYNISRDNDIVTIKQEIENIKTYIQIQQYRFKDRLQFKILNHESEEMIEKCQMPKMTLQPVVENAIYHGLEKKIGTGTIVLHIDISEKFVTILVSDDGVGMSEERLTKLRRKLNREVDTLSLIKEKGNGIALSNVNNRLKILYGEDFGVTASSTQGVGTEIEITIPINLEEEVS